MADIGLTTYRRNHEYFIGIDSDGCAFDTMEIKHKECFIPNFIRCMNLQPISRYARETAEFVNLYSRTRGTNRFPAYLRTLDLLGERAEVRARGVSLPQLTGLREWVSRETRLATRTIGPEAERTGDPDLRIGFEWSRAVDESIAAMVHGVPPFPGVPQALGELCRRADIIVCSATPCAALQSEWSEHGLDRFVQSICGQETGSKAQSLKACRDQGYQPNHMLMIGDAPGDMRAAQSVGCLYYPVIAGREEECWQRFNEESVAKFFDGSYEGDYQTELIREFQDSLPEKPPWED